MKKAAVVALALGLLLSVTPLAFAEDSGASGRPVLASPAGKGLLTACQARMETVQKRSTQLTQRAQNMEDVFGRIAKRVEDYYTNKLVPGGVTVGNYDALVADIAAKKAAVDTALAAAQSQASSFNCTSVAEAKSQIQAFRVAMQNVIAALKSYRTSVRNLIVAVRTASAKLASPQPSASPKP